MKPLVRESDRQVVLRDGRTLGYASYGDPDGRVVVYHHGGLSCRIDATSCHAAASAAGIRVIAVDRPGIGLSDRQKNARLLDRTTDIAELLALLNVSECSTMGWSFGGAYAAACAFALPQVTSLTLIASPLPADWPGMREQINRMDARFMKLSRHAGFVDEAAFVAMRELAQHRPETFIEQTIKDLSPQSVAAITRDPQEFIDATVQAFVHPAGAVDDYRIWDQPWGFGLGDIAVPTQVWFGELDELCPVEWAGTFGSAIGGAEVTVVPGAGHFVARDHWETIFAGIPV